MIEENNTNKTESALELWRQKVGEDHAARRAIEEAEHEEKKKAEKEASKRAAQAEAEKGAKLLCELGLVVDRYFTEENEYGNAYAVCSSGGYHFKVYETGKAMKAVMYKPSCPSFLSNAFSLPQYPGDNVADAKFFIWQKMNWLDERCAEAMEKDREEAERARLKAEQEAARVEALKTVPATPVVIQEFSGTFDAERVKDIAASIARYAGSCGALPLAWRGEMRKRLDATLIDMVIDFGAWAGRERAERASLKAEQDKEGGEIE